MSKFVRQSNEQFNPKLYNNEINGAGYKTACQSLGPQAGGSNGKKTRKTRKIKKRRMRKGGHECSIATNSKEVSKFSAECNRYKGYGTLNYHPRCKSKKTTNPNDI